MLYDSYVYAVLYDTNPSNVHLRRKHTLAKRPGTGVTGPVGGFGLNLICLPSRAYRLHDAKNVRIEEHQRQVELGAADAPLQACHTLLSSECMSVIETTER